MTNRPGRSWPLLAAPGRSMAQKKGQPLAPSDLLALGLDLGLGLELGALEAAAHHRQPWQRAGALEPHLDVPIAKPP